jgi:S-DNA-T family DNA segregation ATPase FtsK/SpoIIIE
VAAKSKSAGGSGAWEFGIIAVAAVLVFGYVYEGASRINAGALASLAATVTVLLAVTGAVAWWWRSLPFNRIRRTWAPLVRGLGLVQMQKAHVPGGGTIQVETLPKIRLRPVRHGYQVTVKLLPGQTPEQYGKHLEAFTHQWRALDVQITSPKRGIVHLRAYFSDPLRKTVAALPEPAQTDLRAVPVGRQIDGSAWLLRLLGTHVLLVGATGAGKGSVQWSTVRGLLPGIRDGWVHIIALDPKRMELSFGRRLFHAYAAEAEAMVELLEQTAADMQERADRYAGKVRDFRPSVTEPFVLVLIDEVAFLTAYQPDKKLRERALAAMATLTTQGRAVGYCVFAALQDPRKEVMGIRGLFPTTIGLRLEEDTQVDMVLGDGALARGARCHEIDEATPGVGYVRLEGSRQVARVRAAYVSDEDIDTMAAETPAPEPASFVKAGG